MNNEGLIGLIGKEVEVTAQGVLYRGTLIEVSETDVFLKGELGWVQLQVDGVTDIRPVSKAR
jgi:hypothetical protein